jgi:hypothetical protein
LYILGWLLSVSYQKTLAIWNFLKFEIWRIWVIVCFPMKNPDGRNHIFSGRNLAKTAAPAARLIARASVFCNNSFAPCVPH